MLHSRSAWFTSAEADMDWLQVMDWFDGDWLPIAFGAVMIAATATTIWAGWTVIRH